MGNDPQFEEEDAALAGGAKAAEPSRAKGAAEMDEEAIKKEWLRAYMEALSAAGAGPGAGAGGDRRRARDEHGRSPRGGDGGRGRRRRRRRVGRRRRRRLGGRMKVDMIEV